MFALISLVFLTPTATKSPEPPPSSSDIVIVGQRLEDAKARLDACIATHCAPDKDIDATLAYAEALLVAGKYRDARTTLLDSLHRNRNADSRYAVDVSDLYRANGRVAAHLGFEEDYHWSTWASYRALKRGTADDDFRRFTARIEIAEMIGRTRGDPQARDYYRSIANDARARGRPDIAALAELRSLIRHYPPGSSRDSAIRRIASEADPNLRAASLEAKLALARMAYERHDPIAAAELQRDFAALNIRRPILIYSPPYEAVDQELTSGNELGWKLDNPGPGGAMSITKNLPYATWSTTKRTPGNFDDMWIDVGFQVTPDGQVADLKILRSQGGTFWAKPLLKSISGRRYTPNGGGPETYRKERYTYTAAYEARSGTKLAGRSPQGRIEYLDMSPRALVSAE